MKTVYSLLFILFTFSTIVVAQSPSEEEILVSMLNEFLEGASYDDAATHDRFWAEDLIYTGSNGNRITKDVIMSGVNQDPDRSVEPETYYSAEEVQIQVYDDMAVVAFRLVAEFSDNRNPDRMDFYNTGTFLKRDGEWRAVAWQATSIPE